VHISFVRSCDLDEWREDQLERMKLGGNGNAKAFFRQHGLTNTDSLGERKFSHRVAQMYKTHLDKLVSTHLNTPGAQKSQVIDSPDLNGQRGEVDGLDQLLLGMNVGSTPSPQLAEIHRSQSEPQMTDIQHLPAAPSSLHASTPPPSNFRSASERTSEGGRFDQGILVPQNTPLRLPSGNDRESSTLGPQAPKPSPPAQLDVQAAVSTDVPLLVMGGQGGGAVPAISTSKLKSSSLKKIQ